MQRIIYFVLFALIACHAPDTASDASTSSQAITQAPRHMSALQASGNGYDYTANGSPASVAKGPAAQVAPEAGLFLGYADGSAVDWVPVYQDQIRAAFAPTLTFASGSGTYELGQTSTPTYNATPATNSATVTGCTIADNQGNGPNSISLANPLNAPIGGGHTYTINAAGSVTVTVAETLIVTGTTRSASASLTYAPRWFHGVDSHSGGNALTASSNNATLSGGSATATLTGALASNVVGQSFTEVPSNQYIYFACFHTSSALNFTAGGFTFLMSRVVTSYAYTNQWGCLSSSCEPVDIYRSDNLLNASFTVGVTL